MPVHKVQNHPRFELGRNTIIALAAPGRGTTENAMFRAELPPGGGLPRHRHDHEDVFTVVSGGGVVSIGDERHEIEVGDCVIVPTGDWHHVEAGSEGTTLVVAMVGGTTLELEDGSERVPPWVS